MPSVYDQAEYRIYYSVFERCWEAYSTKRHMVKHATTPHGALALVLYDEEQNGNQDQQTENQARACGCDCGADKGCAGAAQAGEGTRGGGSA